MDEENPHWNPDRFFYLIWFCGYRGADKERRLERTLKQLAGVTSKKLMRMCMQKQSSTKNLIPSNIMCKRNKHCKQTTEATPTS